MKRAVTAPLLSGFLVTTSTNPQVDAIPKLLEKLSPPRLSNRSAAFYFYSLDFRILAL